MRGTLSVGWNMDGLETPASTRTQQADGAWGSIAIAGAKGLARRSFGSHAKSTPPERSSDDQLRDAVHTGHKEGFPPLKTRLTPLMGVTGVTGSNSGNCKRKGKRDVDWVTVGTETDFAASETLEGSKQRVVSGFPCFPNTLWGLPGVYVTSPFHTEATVFFVPAMHTVSTDKPVKAGADCFCGGNCFD